MVAINIPSNIAFDTYSGLLAAVHSRLDRDDLAQDFPTFIGLAEAMMQRELTLADYETSTNIPITSGVGVLPTNIRQIRKISIDGCEIAQTGIGDHCGVGYTIEAGGLYIWPAPDPDTTAALLYTAKFDGLSEANPTNSLLDESPDVYFWGALAHAADHIGDTARAPQYMTMFAASLDQARVRSNMKKWGGPLRPRLPEHRP